MCQASEMMAPRPFYNVDVRQSPLIEGVAGWAEMITLFTQAGSGVLHVRTVIVQSQCVAI